MWAHDNRFHHNSTGMTTDSFASGHPGMPQDCAKWERNLIYSNNEDYFNAERDAYCKDTPPDQRDPTIVCPTFQVPVGTGIGIFGGNGDIVRDNYFWDNWRDGVKLLFVPAAFRGEPDKGIDTSFDNRFADNKMGVRPDGTRDPNGNDFWWDEEGSGNCWSGNVGPAGGTPSSNVLTGLPDLPGLDRLQPRRAGQDRQPGHLRDLGPVREPRSAGLRLVHPAGGAPMSTIATRVPAATFHRRRAVAAARPRRARRRRSSSPCRASAAPTASARWPGPGDAEVFTHPTLPGDRVLTAKLRNDGLHPLRVDIGDVRLLDSRRPRGGLDAGVPAGLRQVAVGRRPRAAAGARHRAAAHRPDRAAQARPGGAAHDRLARRRRRPGARRLREGFAGPSGVVSTETSYPERPMPENSFDARADLEVGGRSYEIYRLDALQSKYDVARLPFSLKVLLENLLRNEDGVAVRKEDVENLAKLGPHGRARRPRSPSRPARVVMQDFTGVPAVVDLAAMRDAMADLGGDANKINPLVPAELVIDHSVQVDVFGTRDAFRVNVDREYERNEERYAFLRWGQGAFEGFKVVPPGTGIVHQVNLEYLARVVFDNEGTLYPDTLVGTDSHTTMINGLGVLGWGVGGIEAEAAMLGQPMSMLIPRVVGFKLERRAARGRHRHRPRAHRHPDAARARRGRQVRRVLRAGRAEPAARRPRHDRQHEPGVRVHVRDVPDRRGDAALPGVLRPRRRADRDRRGLRARAGPVARRGLRGADLLGDARARPRRGRARRWPARSARRTASR